jgi:2-polyprenyl-3-methyl-5-hydroxy-6-metoxy-1,4-benzoquinol methylase
MHVFRALPQWTKDLVPRSLRDRVGGTFISYESLPSYPYLHGLMRQYQTDRLVRVPPGEFRTNLESFLQLQDDDIEGAKDPSKQRDLSRKFHWGHNHDFGTFSVTGSMGNRHVVLLATLIDWFKALPRVLEGKRILDIGCWSGGTSLLLCAMGASVVAIEEVKKYVDCLQYVKNAFGIDRLEPRNLSLYDCTGPEFQDSFDYVLFAGVLYHLTDPVLGLRITFNCLKDGGKCIVESAISRSRRAAAVYEGPSVIHNGRASALNRGGWNWFVPAPNAISHMMRDVGYANVRLSPIIGSSAPPAGRILAVGERTNHVDMLRAGLSVRTIR